MVSLRRTLQGSRWKCAEPYISYDQESRRTYGQWRLCHALRSRGYCVGWCLTRPLMPLNHRFDWISRRNSQASWAGRTRVSWQAGLGHGNGRLMRREASQRSHFFSILARPRREEEKSGWAPVTKNVDSWIWATGSVLNFFPPKNILPLQKTKKFLI